MSNHHQNAVVLFSGGLDSTTCLYWAKSQFAHITAISFRYGQRHSSELIAAEKISKILGIAHHIIDIDIAKLGGSALTDPNLSVPDYDQSVIYDDSQRVAPITYVPARNTIFLSYALAVAEVSKASAIVIGVSSVDYSGYPDCRPDYIAAFEQLANLATVAGRQGHRLSIIAPLQHLSKAQTLKLGLSLGVDYAQTVSCYQADGDGRACGVCDSCHLRKQGFADAGIIDPTHYQHAPKSQ
ncbi:preQ(0) biosynthesis protein QueC [Moraxella cuniculi DSM 21768]|uniref:7-cyano-7-deazaguanine synthase n=2 Tax=Moraxella cuniculi TaxID=34061 RepID=A0A1N7FUL2_9GAMM|nr:7-cyano-7-deazaguanine synthase QueC [Moraxella cuniculi]OOS05483.1 7-cyano-7-deazaguanine synthase QueC [Moraxella cuniculi]SIS04021.1 preQ(0) biosynthesis protein QueC [Moraxella cuniculi DSM 21768]VEG13466.1 7-cyano-7-deazaguanine synthase [Moraxella cuniculi]